MTDDTPIERETELTDELTEPPTVNTAAADTAEVTTQEGWLPLVSRRGALVGLGTVGLLGLLGSEPARADVLSGVDNNAPNRTQVIGGGQDNVVSGQLGAILGGRENTVSGTWGAVLGGVENTAAGRFSAVGGGADNTASSEGASVGGGESNTASAEGATVGGGQSNAATSHGATVGGGGDTDSGPVPDSAGGGSRTNGNQALGDFSTVAGGRRNLAGRAGPPPNDGPAATVGGGEANTARELGSTVAGGRRNTVENTDATVGGGSDNSAAGSGSTVGGGINNSARSVETTVGGGEGNTASAEFATVGGGQSNTAKGFWATVGGGMRNTAGDIDEDSFPVSGAEFATVGGGADNTAIGDAATVSGGSSNTVDASSATVGGGGLNTASGRGATVPGGVGNTASGPYSFAAGRGATTEATHGGAVVFADSTDVAFRSHGPNEFRSQMPMFAPNVSAVDDRDTKQSVTPVEPLEILDALLDMEVSSWEFTQGDSGRHIGPTASDFSSAFALGTEQNVISFIDADGVAFAAIQGIAQRLAEAASVTADLIAEKNEQLADLEARIDTLEAAADAS